MQKYICSYLILGFFISLITVNSASALAISVSDNVTDFLYLGSPNNTVSGSFDINPALPMNNNYNQPYAITSAYITYDFYDDSSDTIFNGSNFTPYYFYGNNWSRQITSYYYNPFESAQANTEGQTISGATSYFSYNSYSGFSYDGSDYYGIPYFTNYYSYFSGYNGGFTLTQYLDPTRLSSLSIDGTLNFAISTFGDLYFNSAILTAEINENPQSAVVPEPGTMMMLGAGFLGLAVYGKRRRNA